MAFCMQCGQKIAEGAKFCHKCGGKVLEPSSNNANVRQQEYVGKIHKCPNCGEILNSFTANCPACGYELRGVKATSAVKEFANKLEAIEARRERVRGGLLNLFPTLQMLSKTDEQKISLINSFSVPNAKEDIIEFMILASSNVNYRVYDSFQNLQPSKRDIALSDAWIAKVKQVYSKAELSYGSDDDFQRIQSLYNDVLSNISKSKKKGILKWGLAIGWIPLLVIVIVVAIAIQSPKAAQKEAARLEAIENVVIEAIENKEYKKALLNAESLEYKPSVNNGDTDELKRQWKIKRELYIDEILEKAKEDGVELEYRPNEEESHENMTYPSYYNNDAFMNGIQPGLDAAEENINEFLEIINGSNSQSDSTQGGN